MVAKSTFVAQCKTEFFPLQQIKSKLRVLPHPGPLMYSRFKAKDLYKCQLSFGIQFAPNKGILF